MPSPGPARLSRGQPPDRQRRKFRGRSGLLRARASQAAPASPNGSARDETAPTSQSQVCRAWRDHLGRVAQLHLVLGELVLVEHLDPAVQVPDHVQVEVDRRTVPAPSTGRVVTLT